MLPFDNKTKPVSVNNENSICSKSNYFLDFIFVYIFDRNNGPSNLTTSKCLRRLQE